MSYKSVILVWWKPFKPGHSGGFDKNENDKLTKVLFFSGFLNCCHFSLAVGNGTENTQRVFDFNFCLYELVSNKAKLISLKPLKGFFL